MRRGILLAALAVLATALAPARAAAPSPYVVYEVVRVRPGGPQLFDLEVAVREQSGPGIALFAEIVPIPGHYQPASMAVATSYGAGTRVTSYGMPVPVPACAAPPACGGDGAPTGAWGMTVRMYPLPGHRFVVAVPRGAGSVTPKTPYWRAKPAALAFRTVTGESSGATGASGWGLHAEVFRSAAAPGGRHGSAAFAEIPCWGHGAGSATMRSDDGENTKQLGCVTGMVYAFDATTEGREWTLTGNVAGRPASPYRLAVLDLPRH